MRRYLALFAAAYFLLALLVTAPSSLLNSPLMRLSEGRLSLANCQGTIWHGSATPVLHLGKNSDIALHLLDWRIRPQAVLKGQLNAVLHWDQSATSMELTLDRQSVILTRLQLPLPAEIIGELSPYLKPAQFSGRLFIESPQLSYTGHHLSGNATAHWDQAGSALSAVQPLGNYQLDMVADQQSLHAVLTTEGGALLLAGTGSWSPAQKFNFNGTASATEASRPMLAELLHHLGPEETPGVYKISL
ncbi:MAG: type II secretion system protein N [Gallionella sp.]|nr:type II secretion system protein N [Gallionella sp.]